ncbi:MAG: hypothetical protein JSR19_13130 [Proteobacteria bacterium]|nr:hypothetical protein [Pseudomonadota bacterium]HQR03449.1 ElyC/SanA/YdcF family protein [Rhodocyclaceae bacterium]
MEGWLNEKELDQAVAVFLSGRYERVFVTGGPVETWQECRGSSNYADFAAAYLRTHGLQEAAVIAVPAPASAQDRTFLSAVRLRDWAAKQHLVFGPFDVFSAGTHARRSRLLYRMAFGPNVEVGVLSARPQEYDGQHWWRTSAGAKSVLEEAIGLLWTICFFHPAPPGSYEELWNVPYSAVAGSRGSSLP